MKFFNIIAGVFLTTSGFNALAESDSQGTGLFLEPGISYQLIESTVDYPTPLRNSSAVNRGFGLLGRAGIHVYDRFFVAADARYALLNYKDNANNYTANAQSWDIGPVVGMQMADYGVRLYVGYVLAGNLDPSSSRGFDYRFEDPTGWRVGAGLKLMHLSVNIEWQRLHYGKTSIQQAGSITPGTSISDLKFDGEGLIASVTFPMEFN